MRTFTRRIAYLWPVALFSLWSIVGTDALADSPALDRPVAEWVCSLGGWVQFDHDSRRYHSPQSFPARELRLTTVDLVGTNILPPDLVRLSSLQWLQRLYLPGPMWNTGAGARTDYSRELKHLAPIHTLETLTFSYTYLEGIKFNDAGIEEIASLGQSLKRLSIENTNVSGRHLAAFTELESLDLVSCPVNERGIEQIKSLTKLSELLLRDALFHDDDLLKLSGLRQLRHLDIGGTAITDEGATALQNMPKLRKLNLQGTDVTDDSVQWLVQMPMLEELNLYGTDVTNAGLSALESLANLRSLDLRYSNVTRLGVERFLKAVPKCRVDFVDAAVREPLPAVANRLLDNESDQRVAQWVASAGGSTQWEGEHLVRVDLAGTSIHDELLANLSKSTSIQSLDLSFTEIGDTGIEALLALVEMRDIDLRGTQITDDGLARLANLRRIRSINVSHTQIEGTGFENWDGHELEVLDASNSEFSDNATTFLSHMPELADLSLAFSRVTNKGVKHFVAIPKLEALDLSATDISDEAAASIGAMPGLLHLSLSHTGVTDKGLAKLSPLNLLESLGLVRTRVTSEGMSSLASMMHLSHLNLDYTDVDDAGLSELANLKELKSLSLDSTNITDKSAEVISRFPQLDSLNLYHTFFTTSGVRVLKRSLPNCDITWDVRSSSPTRRRS